MVCLKFICIHLVDLYDECVNRPYIEKHPKQQPQHAKVAGPDYAKQPK